MRKEDAYLVRIAVKDEQGNVTGEIDAVSFKGLLALAHEDGLRSVRTKLLRAPSADNGQTTIVRATVRTNRGTFTGLGDANAENVNAEVARHSVRVAETRAIARAFRLAVNVGETTVDELMGNIAYQQARAPHGRDSSGAPDESRDANANGRSGNGSNGTGATSGGQVPPPRFRGRDTQPAEADLNDRRAMTDEQRKLLFRLAFELGSRETAKERILKALGVERLEWATRADASRAIDVLRREANSRKNGHSSNGQGADGEAGHGS